MRFTKESYRKFYQSKRNQLNEKEIFTLSQQICLLFKQHFSVENKMIHTFLSCERLIEVNTQPINDFLFHANCMVVTSITTPNLSALKHSVINKNTNYQLDRNKIPVPVDIVPVNISKINLVLIPLLAFDEKGNRLGYGKGLYDAFLAQCSNDCLKVGVSFFGVTAQEIPSENHDVKLDFCITPLKLYQF